MPEPADPLDAAPGRPPIPAPMSHRAQPDAAFPPEAPALATSVKRLLDALALRPGILESDLGPLRELVVLAEACERAWADERRRHERRLRLEALLPRLAGSLDVREVFGELAAGVGEVIPHDVLAFALLLPDRSGVRVRAATGQGIVDLPPYRFSNEEEALDANWGFLLAYDLAPVDGESVRARISPAGAPELREVVTRPGAQWMRFIAQAGIRSSMRVPIRSENRPIGGLAFMSRAPDAFDAEDGQVASRLADHLALAIAHQRLAEEQNLRDRMRALDPLLPEIEKLADPAEIAEAVERISQGIVDHDSVGVMVAHSNGGSVRGVVDRKLRLESELTPEFLESMFERLRPLGSLRILEIEVLDEEKRLVRQHIAAGEERFVRVIEAPESSFRALKTTGARSQLWAGVHQGRDLIGVLIFASREPAHFTEVDEVLAKRIAVRISLRLALDRFEGVTRQAREATARARQLEARVDSLQRELERFSAHRAIGQSASWRKALEDAARVSATDTTVLVTGESGTGKEVIARCIHRASQRAKGPFVALNCAALPEQLLESELFGHERGAFTGAIEPRAGRIEQALGGVLFLDEVGEMSPAVQAKFLRVLQEREFQRVGGAKVLKADVRIVAATNRDPRAAIAAGQFREDLYYRLGVFEIHLPPLRERPEDILVLAQAFLEEIGNTIGQPAAGISDDAREQLLAHPWPGNVRELRNAIERAVIMCGGGLVTRAHLPISVSGTVPGRVATAAPGADAFPPGGIALQAVERQLLEQAMERAGRNKSQAAKLLGLTRGQLYSLLRRHGLTDARR